MKAIKAILLVLVVAPPVAIACSDGGPATSGYYIGVGVGGSNGVTGVTNTSIGTPTSGNSVVTSSVTGGPTATAVSSVGVTSGPTGTGTTTATTGTTATTSGGI